MKKYKIPIGNLFGGFNRNQQCAVSTMILFSVILYRKITIISILIIFSLLIYFLIIYYKSHRLTLQDKNLNVDIKWHTLTEKEHLFLRAYYRAKLEVYVKSLISTLILLIIANIVLYINESTLFIDILIISAIYIVISFIVMIHLSICTKIDTSAECTYIPIKKKYSVDHSFKGRTKINNYAIIITNHRKYIYKIDDFECNEIMVINYKGLSYAINSKVLPY